MGIRLLILTLIFGTLACSERPIGPIERIDARALFGVPIQAVPRGAYGTIELDAEFLSYVDSAAGFGGFYFDEDGSLTAFVKGEGNHANARSFLARFLDQQQVVAN